MVMYQKIVTVKKGVVTVLRNITRQNVLTMTIQRVIFVVLPMSQRIDNAQNFSDKKSTN